jgi:transcriptional regulator with XRE-family HTH domain
MRWHEAFLKSLKKDLERRQNQNSAYSTRKYAQVLGVSIGTLSELLNGKRKITVARAREMLALMNLETGEQNRILSLMGDDIEVEYSGVEPANFDIYTDWRAQAIAGLFELENIDLAAPSIAKRLKLDEKYVTEKINEFVERGILIRKPGGLLVRPKENWLSRLPPDVKEQANQEQLNLAELALRNVPAENREFRAITFSGSAQAMELFRLEMVKVLNRFSALADDGAKEQLYRVSIQAFPFDFEKRD